MKSVTIAFLASVVLPVLLLGVELKDQPVKKMRLAIMDFTSVDIEAEKYLRHTEKKSVTVKNSSLTDEDLANLPNAAVRVVKLGEVADRMEQNRVDRHETKKENDRDRERRDKLRQSLLGQASGRPIVIGADVLAACLLNKGDLFDIVDRKTIEESQMEISFGESGNVDSKQVVKVGQMTGASHLLYGIVQDFARDERVFSGYGVKNNNIEYRLTVLIRIIDIAHQSIVFSDEFTGRQKELITEFASHNNPTLAKDLMKDALQQATKAIYGKFTPVAIQLSPALTKPKVTIQPRGEEGDASFNPKDVEVYVDGLFKGNAPTVLELASGEHTIEMRLNGYKTTNMKLNVDGGESLNPRLIKEK